MLIGGLIAFGLIVVLLIGTVFHQSLKYFRQANIFGNNFVFSSRMLLGAYENLRPQQ